MVACLSNAAWPEQSNSWPAEKKMGRNLALRANMGASGIANAVLRAAEYRWKPLKNLGFGEFIE
jgi:hypothetical protein